MSYLQQAAVMGASDVHLAASAAATFRVDGDLVKMGKPLASSDIEGFASTLMTREQWQRLQQTGEVDFAWADPHSGRFRISVFKQQGSVSVSARLIPARVPTLLELELPDNLVQFAELNHGLVLVTGSTGSGKSTTLASLIHHINHTRGCHIVTLEDPTEYRHEHALSIVNQREVGSDTRDFSTGLRACLRQDMDVILIGEMRDTETVHTALKAAETGHLVMSTMHTGDAVEAISRLIHMYPAEQQDDIRVQLAGVLRGIIAQQLVKRRHGTGRIAAVEVLVNTPAVTNLIRLGKFHQIRSALQTGRPYGMQTMEMHLKELTENGKI